MSVTLSPLFLLTSGQTWAEEGLASLLQIPRRESRLSDGGPTSPRVISHLPLKVRSVALA